MYESPIRLLVQQLETSIREQQEKQIFEAVQKCGVDVDREELVKALAYDRAQYAQGYSDGRADVMPRWISVEEMLPEADGKYIVCTAKRSVYCTKFRAYGRGGSFQTDINTHITHWMPLPEPPKEE